MGIYADAWLHYTFVFDKDILFPALSQALKDQEYVREEEDELDFGIDYETEELDMALPDEFTLRDSVDLISGHDIDKELYVIMLNTGGHTGASSSGLIKDEDLIIDQNSLVVLETFLKPLGLWGKEKKKGWFIRAYLS